MKLYGSLTSPFVRLCRVTADAHDLDLPLRQVKVMEDDGFRTTNPLGKVPALLLDSGTLLPDSGVIVRYLDEQGRMPSLYTRGGLARYETDALVSLACGVLDLGVANFLEGLRPAAERSVRWIDRREAGINAGIAAMNEAALRLPEDAGIADFAFACCCDWLSLRLPTIDWRSHKALDERVGRLLETPRFIATDPRAA